MTETTSNGTLDTAPRVWVGCVRCHNVRHRQVGEWVDLVELNYYDTSTPKTDEERSDEGYLLVHIHGKDTPLEPDCDRMSVYDTANAALPRDMHLDRALDLCEKMQECERVGLDFDLYLAYCDHANDPDADPVYVKDAHYGSYSSYDDFGYDHAEAMHIINTLDGLDPKYHCYFDFESYGRDTANDYMTIELGGELHFFSY